MAYTVNLRVLVDRPVVEVFVQGGRDAYVYADTSFNTSATQAFLFNNGDEDVELTSLSIFEMDCGWTSELPLPKELQMYPRGI